MVIELEPSRDGFMLTQYESKGILDRKDFNTYIRDEYVHFDITDLQTYNEFEYTRQEPNPIYDDLDMLLDGYKPSRICAMCQYGKFNYGFAFHRLDGYGNIESLEKYTVEKEMNENEDFKGWYIKNYVKFNDNNLIDKVIAEGNRLVAMGY